MKITSRFAASEPIPSVSVNGTLVIPVNSARSLGVVLDRHLTLSSHVNNVCKSASLAIRNIGRIRRYLSQNDTERLVHAFVTSKLDSCNSLIYGLPACQEAKLQRIQNSAARLVAGVKKFDHISPVLNNLHWLTVRKRITFKILLITYKALHGLAPTYLSELLTVYKPSRCLRSEISNLLVVPKCRTKLYGERAFAVAAPTLWNKLPSEIKNSASVAAFKTSLKTFLFKN